MRDTLKVPACSGYRPVAVDEGENGKNDDFICHSAGVKCGVRFVVDCSISYSHNERWDSEKQVMNCCCVSGQNFRDEWKSSWKIGEKSLKNL